jgi:flagellar basal body-associated protein FliL
MLHTLLQSGAWGTHSQGDAVCRAAHACKASGACIAPSPFLKNCFLFGCIVDGGIYFFSPRAVHVFINRDHFSQRSIHMKQPDQPAKKPSPALLFLIISLVVLVAGAAGIAVFVNLNQTVKMTSGKVVETFTKKEFATRKQTVDREYEVVRYTVDGKEYTKKTAMPRTGGSSQYITVYYYEKYPGLAWFFKKGNSNIFFCSLIAALAAAGVLLSAMQMKKSGAAATQPQKQLQAKKVAKT